MDNLVTISDTFTTKTAVNNTRYSDIAGMLALYPEGSPIIVTYYHKIVSEIDVRSGVTDLSPHSNSVHKDYTKILQFEMRMIGQLESNFEEVDNGFAITGEAIVYPGFIPHIGDEFLLDVGDGKIGEFKLTNVIPTTYRQGRCHKVSFEIIGYLEPSDLATLESGVRETVYFEKNSYVGDGWTEIELRKYMKYYSRLRYLEHIPFDEFDYLKHDIDENNNQGILNFGIKDCAA